jgi:hypothetical protein
MRLSQGPIFSVELDQSRTRLRLPRIFNNATVTPDLFTF